MGRRRLEPQNGEREIAWERKSRNLQPQCTRMRVRQQGKKRLGQQTEGRERRCRSSQRFCSRRRRPEKDMVSTVRALIRDPLRRGWGRVARGMLWIVVCRDRDGDRGVGMTGCQARLRTVEEESQEKEHRR